MKPMIQAGIARHERIEEMLEGTQYGEHCGLDADERLWVDSPHEQIGRPKGDNNRGLGRRGQVDPFFDYVD